MKGSTSRSNHVHDVGGGGIEIHNKMIIQRISEERIIETNGSSGRLCTSRAKVAALHLGPMGHPAPW